jgi:hypothetical protein
MLTSSVSLPDNRRMRFVPLALVSIAVLVVLAAGGSAASSTAGGRAGGSPQVVVALVRFAFALEKDALYHQTGAPAEAKKELDSAAAVLGHALALGPTGSAATDLRQALTKDQDAASLLGTPNEGKVKNDIAGALNFKEAALKALGQSLVGPFVPPQVVKPPLPLPKKSAKPAWKKVSRQKIADLVASAAIEEYDAAHSDLPNGKYGHGYDHLYAAQEKLIRAIEAAYGDPTLGKVVKLLNGALVKDLTVITGTWIEHSDSINHTLRNAVMLKAQAMNALGYPPLAIMPLKATFDISQRATYYDLSLERNLVFKQVVGEPTFQTKWTLTLQQIDPPGSSPPGYQSTNKNAPNYASAAFDPTCNDSLLNVNKVTEDATHAVYTWSGGHDSRGAAKRFTWYHGDPSSYPPIPYGCDHTKMGLRGHQGIVSVVVTNDIWTCHAEIEGTNLTPTPVEGGPAYCHPYIDLYWP